MNDEQTIAIVTDSATGAPEPLLRAMHIESVPFPIHIDGRAYRDGIDIQPEEFFRKLRAQSEPNASTGVPPLAAFVEAYRQASAWAQGIVSVHIAGRQSGTCNAARLAGRECALPVAVVDTGSTAMAEGFVVLEAARAAAAGGTLESVAARACEVAENVGLVAMLGGFTYAVRGGRLSGAARTVGNFLNILPLIRVKSNRVGLIGQARRRSKGLRQLVDRLVDEAGDLPVHVSVHYAEDRDEGAALLAAIETRVNCVEKYLLPVPTALGVHAGPGSIGVAYYIDKRGKRSAHPIERLTGYAREAFKAVSRGAED